MSAALLRTLVPHPMDSRAAAMDEIVGVGGVHVPLPSLKSLIGKQSRGSIVGVTAATGQGKTTFLLDNLARWAERGVGWDCFGTEQSPAELWLKMACRLEGIPPYLALTGAWDEVTYEQLSEINWTRGQLGLAPVDRAEALEWAYEARQDALLAWAKTCRFVDCPTPTLGDIEEYAIAAVERGASVLVIDHWSRVGLGGAFEYGDRKAMMAGIKQIAKRHGLNVWLMVQQNRTTRSGDHLASYQPPKAVGMEGGGFVEQECDVILGLWRPIRGPEPGEDPKAYADRLKAARAGEIEPKHVLMPHTMGVVLLKHRAPPPKVSEGDRVMLTLRYGRIVDDV